MHRIILAHKIIKLYGIILKIILKQEAHGPRALLTHSILLDLWQTSNVYVTDMSQQVGEVNYIYYICDSIKTMTTSWIYDRLVTYVAACYSCVIAKNRLTDKCPDMVKSDELCRQHNENLSYS